MKVNLSHFKEQGFIVRFQISNRKCYRKGNSSTNERCARREGLKLTETMKQTTLFETNVYLFTHYGKIVHYF